MRRSVFISALSALIFIATPPVGVEAKPDEIEAWGEAGLRIKALDELRLNFSEELRLGASDPRFRGLMSEGELIYRSSDYFSAAAGYRLMYEPDNDDRLRFRHRYTIDAEPGFSVDEFSMELRVRYFGQIREGDDDGEPFRHGGRVRLKLEYDFGMVEPYLAAELFSRFDGWSMPEPDKIRNTAGVSIKIGQNTLKIFYHLEVPIEPPDDPLRHIFGLGYACNFEVRAR